MPTALIVGASSGIGLALARRWLEAGWDVWGLARRGSPLEHPRYRHRVADVCAPGYREVLATVLAEVGAARDPAGPAPGALDVCVYAAGIGEPLELAHLEVDGAVFATNLIGAVTTIEVVLPPMIAARAGHVIGLSSQADQLVDEFAPSYAASKAGMSSYLEGLALACRPHQVAVTNVRLGFVDTAMSRHATVRPFLISAERAAAVVDRCLRRRPLRVTHPWRMAALLWMVRWPRRLWLWFA